MSKSSFDLGTLIQQLSVASRSDEAQRLARLLLDHVFGEKDVMVFADVSDRDIPAESWNTRQRRVMTALAGCAVAWPEIAFFVQESLELEFEPTQAELQATVASLPASKKPSKKEKKARRSAEEQTTPPTEDEVLEAVRRLLAVFEASDSKTNRELKHFARFRPHAASAVLMLLELMKSRKLEQRSAVAWVLGQIGPVARAAVPALMKALRDWENESVTFALAQIGLDDYEPLLAMIHSRNPDLADRAWEALSETKLMPAELVQRLLTDTDNELRLLSVGKLRYKAAPQSVPQLLQLLDDDCKDVAIQARYGLTDAGPAYLPVVLAAVEGASLAKRRLLAEVMAEFPKHLHEHLLAVTAWLLRESSGGVRKQLLAALGKLKTPPPEVVAALRQLAEKRLKPAVFATLLRTMAKTGAAEFVPLVIEQAESALDPGHRLAAFLALRAFRKPAETILAYLERALSSPSQEAQLQAIWSLYYRGQEAVPILIAKLNAAPSERVKAEIAWALGLLGAESAGPALRCLQDDGAGVASSIAGWAVERLEAEPCR